jgi:ankyrin repeat protein
MWHYKEMIPLLLEAGADPNSKAGAGRTAQKNSTALSKIISLTLNNKSEEEYQIVEMFLSHGADPNIPHKTAGTTPLIQAVFKADIRLVKLFLEHGADLDLKDNQGRTALDIAKKKNYPEVIDLLQ